MSTSMSRRRFIAVAAAAGAVVPRGARAGTPPKESGLSSEGLLVGRPGFQPRTTMPLPYQELPGFLSREQLAAHYEDYVGAVERLKATEDSLRATTMDTSRYADLRRAQVTAANGVLLHELYFGGLSARKIALPRHIESNMTEHMGLWESWRDDFTRCALTAKTWAILLYDPYDDRWHDAVMDGDNDGVWVGANPLVVCDVAEHAFSRDYQTRAEYVAKFIDHIDWNQVSVRYKSVDRM